MLLPAPDSPTIATNSPGRAWIETSSTIGGAVGVVAEADVVEVDFAPEHDGLNPFPAALRERLEDRFHLLVGGDDGGNGPDAAPQPDDRGEEDRGDGVHDEEVAQGEMLGVPGEHHGEQGHAEQGGERRAERE